MSSSLSAGSRVAIVGLTSCAQFNGQRGTLRKFDLSALRWEVNIDDVGFKKLRAENLKVDVVQQVRKRRLCKYGDACYRPGCWYVHDNAQQRCEHFANVWNVLLKEKAPSSLAISPSITASHQTVAELADLRADVYAQKNRWRPRYHRWTRYERRSLL